MIACQPLGRLGSIGRLRPFLGPQKRWFSAARVFSQLPSEKQAQQSAFRKEATQWLDRMQARAMDITQRFRDVSGYSEIDEIKRKIDEGRTRASDLRHAAEAARKEYTAAVAERTSSQKEVNELLQRKNNWSAEDLERFTKLYREDHIIEQRVEEAGKQSTSLEEELEQTRIRLGKLMGVRYREEQIWSDKIRQASTWGTMIIMGVNVFLFFVLQLVIEPWKRKRLVRGFEEKVETALAHAGLVKEQAIEAAISQSKGITPESVRAASQAAAQAESDTAEGSRSVGPASPAPPVLPNLPGLINSNQPLADLTGYGSALWAWLVNGQVSMQPLSVLGYVALGGAIGIASNLLSNT